MTVTNTKSKKSGALLVGAGILLSRIAGLIRERAFAHYFGNSDAGDAFKAALKIPNFLQNLFGEGVLSASFIPVYAQLVASNDKEKHIDAAKVASIIASILFLFTSLIVIAGVFATPVLISVIAPGFQGEKKELTIKLVQIFFPGTGLLVMSAWCLGVLNSHHKFFLSYAAPVIWNITIIATLFWFGKNNTQYNLAEITAWGLVLGSFLQFAIQLPFAVKLVKHFRPSLNLQLPHVKTVIKNFFPVVISRGVVQLSAYIDSMLASLLPTGAVSALAYAQTIYLLPVSLFGMSISASELPAMSALNGTSDEINTALRIRLDSGLHKIAFFIIPSICAFLFLGDVLVAALFQSGKFNHTDTIYVWGVLIGSTIGLLASTLGRLYSSTFYSLKDTRTPLKFAIIRVILTTILGYLFAFTLPKVLNIEASWGTAGLTASAGISGWIEFYLLRRALNLKIGTTGIHIKGQIVLWSCGIVSGGIGFLVKYFAHLSPIFEALIVFSFFGVAYFIFTYILNVEESRTTISKIIRKVL
jgi:putative peptidoglycan lipid II flippase